MIEMRRHKDIVAFRRDLELPTAFHAQNLEVAEISEELWQSLIPTKLSDSNAVQMPLEQTDSEVFAAAEEWLHENNPDVQSGSVPFGIRSLTLNVTQICNLHCTYCAAGGDGTYGDAVKRISIEKTLPQIKFFMEKLSPGQSFHISFIGGEPLLYPEAIQMIGEHAAQIAASRKIPLSFKVTTNGTLFTDRVLAILKTLKAHVVVSIDGPAEINDRVRPQKNKQPITEKIIQGIRMLAQDKLFLGSLGLHGVFNKNNMEIEKAYEFYLGLGVDWFEFTYAVDEHDFELNQEYMKKMKSIAEKAWATGGERELRKISNFDHFFKILDSQRRVENHCGSGKSLVVVDARNRIYGCPWAVGKSQEQMGQDTQLDMSKFEALKESLIEKNDCGSCWARYLCGGGCMFIHQGRTGNKHKKDPEFCERTRFLVSLSIMYYKRSREASQNYEV